MFVSVRERTNIIGIQKALGAKRFFILQQFLVESMLLSIIGGLLGVFLIFIATSIINYLYDLDMYLTMGNVVLAIFISGLIGVVAGYAPANTASKMNPVGKLLDSHSDIIRFSSIHTVSWTNCSTDSCSGRSPNSW